MTTRNRATLKQFFEEGRRPSSDHFGDLIDSMLNMSDEGFRKTPEHGFEVTSDEALLSFFREQNGQDPIWALGFGGDNNQLLLRAGDGSGTAAPPPVLALDVGGQVGIGTDRPTVELDVRGVIASHGRQGQLLRHTPEGAPLLADGNWHALTGPLKGCQAFEITAGVGLPDAGRFAMLHAVAMNTFNPQPGWLDFLSRRKRIRSQHAWYGQRCDRLALRWEGSSGRHGSYHLAVRTQCNYGSDCVIQVSLTSLWSDPFMTGAPKP